MQKAINKSLVINASTISEDPLNVQAIGGTSLVIDASLEVVGQLFGSQIINYAWSFI